LNDDSAHRSAQTQTLLRRAAALSVRAGALQRAQAQYEGQVARQVTAVARSAARFFDQLGLPDFPAASLPPHARYVRNVRQKTLCYQATSVGDTAIYRAVLLGSDGRLRLYSARSPLESQGGGAASTVYRDVSDWSAQRAVEGLSVNDVLASLDAAMDVVERHVAEEEERLSAANSALGTRPERPTDGSLHRDVLLHGTAAALKANAAEPSTAERVVGPFAAIKSYVDGSLR
jgi:hypothetical protein